MIHYLEENPTKDMLNEIIVLSGLTIRDTICKNEREYKDNNLDNNTLTHDEIL